MKCNLLLSCLLVVASTSLLFSQPCDPVSKTTFSTTYLGGDNVLDYGIAAVEKSTGGYAVLGLRQTAVSSTAYQLYFSLLEADGDVAAGTPVLINLKKPTSSAVLFSPSTVTGAKIIEVSDASGVVGYAFCALVKDTSNLLSVVLGRLNLSGGMVWVKTFSQFNGVTDTPVGLFQESSPNNLVLFVSRSLGHGSGYLSVLTVAFGGGSCFQFDYLVGTNQSPAFTPTAVARLMSPVRYAVGGNLNSNASVLYLDQSLNPVSGVHCPSYNFDGNTATFETITDLRQDGSQLVVAGRTSGSGFFRSFLSKVTINSNAAPAWTRMLEVSSLSNPLNLNASPTALEVIPGGGYVVGGTVSATGILPRAFLVRTDANGAPTWLKHYRETNNTNLYDGLLASDGGFCFVGTQFGSSTASSQFGVKTDELGRLADCDCWDSTIVSSTQPTGTFITSSLIINKDTTCSPVEVKNTQVPGLAPEQGFCDKFSPISYCEAFFSPFDWGCGQMLFTNYSNVSGTPSWNWTFPGGSPSSSTAQHPIVTFPMSSSQVACLTVTNSANPPLQCTFCDTFPVPCDTIPPVLTCPPDAQVECGDSFDPAVTGQPLFGDNCGPDGVALSFTDLILSGNITCTGQIRRTWTVADSCGNVSNCIQLIDIFDPDPPIPICKSALVVALDASCQATISPADVDNGSFDNCPAPVSFSLSQSTFDADDACKNIPVALTVTDCAGNFETCFITVSVTTDFTLTCPANITAIGIDGINGCVANVTVPAPIVTHACAGVTVTNDHPGGNFPEGTTTVTWMAFDDCGNEESCQMTVTVGCGQSRCGEAVVTCFPGFVNDNPSQGISTNPVVGIVDVRDQSTGLPGTLWTGASGSNIYHPAAWNHTNLGLVFGIALDATDNIYLSATTLYGCKAGAFNPEGPAGAAGIYRIDPADNISTLISTVPAWSGPGTAALPNTGSGLGNHCFDEEHNQLFVTNFHDGMIYRINLATGLVEDRFDPFTTMNNPSSGNANFVELGERSWGIDYNPVEDRLYFSRWREDRGRPLAVEFNEIWSVDILPGGGFDAAICSAGTCSGNDQLEIRLPDHLETSGLKNYSNPVSDIEFNHTGLRMLVAERTMIDDCTQNQQSHFSRVLEYVRNATGAWVLPSGHSDTNPFTNYNTELQFQIGTAVGAINGANSAGGVDYGYDSFVPPGGAPPVACDSMVWMSGDYLRCPNLGTNVYYGIQGNRAWGGDVCTGWLVDFNGIAGTQDKTRQGDVEIFECGCPLIGACPPECVADQLIISTGFNGFTNSLLNPGDPDPLWTLVSEPSGGPVLTTPQPAWVVDAYLPDWYDLPGSQWISPFPFNDQDQNNCTAANCSCEPYTFERCFCVCQDDSVRIVFDMMSDDRAEVLLMQGSTQIDLLANNCASPGKQFQLITHADKTFFLTQGRYCLESHLWNTNTVAMGFNLDGFIEGASVEKDVCCSQVTAIVGVKFCDDDCDGVRDFNSGTYSSTETGLPGWTIQLCDANGNLVASTVTDAQGVYVFNNVPPGTYTVKEVQQDGWTPSTPAGGSQVVTLGQNQIIDLDFGNCPPKCADLLEMEVTDCDPDKPKQYYLNFILENITDNPGFIISQLSLTSLTPGIKFLDCSLTPSTAFPPTVVIALPVSPTLSQGQSSSPMCVQIVTSAPLVGATTFCFHVSVSGPDMSNGGQYEWCSQKKPFCITLLPCCDPCEDRSVVPHPADPPPNSESDCCHSLDIENGCDVDFFTKLELALLTPGVNFGSAYTGASGVGWTLQPPTPDLLIWTHSSGYLPGGMFPGLLNFCIEDIDNIGETPQTVVLRWITAAADGTDSVACTDTLVFDCGRGCMKFLGDSISCEVDEFGTPYYTYSLTFQNISTHEAYDMMFLQTPDPPAVTVHPNSAPFGTVINPGDIGTVTVNIIPKPPGGYLAPGTKLTFLVRLHDAEAPLPEWCCEFPDTLCIIIPSCDSCACGGFYEMETVGLNPNLSFDCGAPPVTLPCLDGMEGFWIDGDHICTDDCWQGSFFQLTHESGAAIPQPDFYPSYPHWDVFIPASSLTLPGTYTLNLFQQCGDDFCQCQMSFALDSTCFDTCDCDDFVADVAAGFDVDVTQCRERLFAPYSLEECDQVTWLVNNQVVGTSTGNGDFTYPFPADGTYTVCMRVERHLPDGSICPPTLANTKCLTLNVVCAPPFITCDSNGVENGSFAEFVQEGHLGYSGGVSGWDWAFWLGGDVWLLDDPGCMDEGYLVFAGGSVRMAAVQQQVTIPASHDGMHVSFCYRKMQQGDLPPGTFLHLLASENSNLSIGAVTPLLSLELNPSPPGSPLDDNGWQQRDITSLIQGAGLNYFYLTVLVDNDQPESTPPSTTDLSLVGFDNLCFQTYDDTNDPFVPNNDGNLVALSPNPISEASPELTMRFNHAPKESSKLLIVDLWGRTMQVEILSPDQSEYSFWVQQLPAGVYFVKLFENGEPVWMKKIVKQ